MENSDIKRIKKLQRDLSQIQARLNEMVLEAASGGGKLSLEDLEISVSNLASGIGLGAVSRRPLASRRPDVVASRRPLDAASRRPLDVASRRPIKPV